MRAASPADKGCVSRDGIDIRYEVFGGGGTTLLLIPPAPITHSRIWKAQIPFLSRRDRVVVFDARGNGGSGRPTDPQSHRPESAVGDIEAVMDATGTHSAILVAHCHANWWAVAFAAAHPERVAGLVAIEPGVPYIGRPQQHWLDAGPHWDDEIEDPVGWELYNRRVIAERHREWVEFFFSEQLVESHSTKQWEDAVGWALESTGDVLVPLIPHKQLSMEQALEFCREDECVEVTPATVRLRKVVLDAQERNRTRARAKRQSG